MISHRHASRAVSDACTEHYCQQRLLAGLAVGREWTDELDVAEHANQQTRLTAAARRHAEVAALIPQWQAQVRATLPR